jgi:hypothetical protein
MNILTITAIIVIIASIAVKSKFLSRLNKKPTPFIANATKYADIN